MRNLTQNWAHSLAWGNPYTSPPAGMPKVIKMIENGERKLSEITKKTILANWPKNAPFKYYLGCGYSWHLHLPIKKRKQWSEETKRAARAKRTATMIRKKYPLFADEFIERANAEITKTEEIDL